MIARLAALMLIAAGLAPVAHAQAPADDAGIERLIRGAYASYVAADATPRPDIPLSPRLRAAETECAALQKKIDAKEGEDSSFGQCSEDYDLLCQCQDPFGVAWPQSGIAIVHPSADRAEAVVTFPPVKGGQADGKPGLKWLFVRGPKGWLIDDFWEYAQAENGAEGSYRTRLVASIQAMRAKLGLPAWREPPR